MFFFRLQATHTMKFAAGVRQVVTGLAQLQRTEGKLLCTSMCIGSGMGAAGIFVSEAR
jgi:acetyl-CoA acyltransferase 1